MFHHHRKLVILLCLAVAVIGISVGLRWSRESPGQVRQAWNNLFHGGKLEIDTSFFQPAIPVTLSDESAIPISETAPIVLPAAPYISAKAYLVGDVATGELYLTQNSQTPLPVASMSKLITAFAATDSMLDDTVIHIMDPMADVPPDNSGIATSESYTLKEILQPLLLASSNIAAEAIASSGDRAKFLELMSGYAWEVGMSTSFFADPSGVSPRNIASARDMFALARYLYKSRPDILAVTRTAHVDIATTTEHGGHSFDSTHPFVRDSRFIGGKTGRTLAAGETMLTILKIDNKPIVFVVMGSLYGQRESDTRKLLEKYEKLLK